MTSVDDLFKKPNLPAGSFKRKFETPNAEQAYKATKLTSNGSPHNNGRNATIEDGGEEGEDNDDDIEAGPSLPPEDLENDDVDGRFFGDGVSRDAAEALDYIDEQDAEGYKEEKLDSAWLKRLATSFEKKVNKNAELRARYESEPSKFMASEADLDAEVKSWSLLSEHPELYQEFAASEAVSQLVGLLAHENTDIAIGAIEIISELLDQDVEAEEEQWDAMVSALLDADLLELLMSDLSRLDEDHESDRSGVYHSLAVMESLASQPATAEKIAQPKVLEWLCNRIRRPEKLLGQNKQYAAEVLQVLLQSSPIIRRRLAIDVEGVDLFLQLLAPYRKRDPPKESHEEEYAENLFDALACVVDEHEGKARFLDAEGVELCLIMLREGSFSKTRSLRVLDHAVGGQGATATEVGVKLVEAAGLKTVFGLFAKKTDSATIEHLLGIFASLLRLLPGESAVRIRMIAKFEEKRYDKVDKLVMLREQYANKVAGVDKEIELEEKMLDLKEREERSGEWLSRRLDGGLFCSQTIDTVLAWLIAETASAKKHILAKLGSLDSIRASLQEQSDGLDPEAPEDRDTGEMLATLISFLR